MPSNRVSQAEYLVKCSSKAQYVLKEALRLQAENKKLIVYCDWPSSVYLMKLVFDVLDMHAARISAGQSAKERSAIIGQFNDSRNEDVKILVASSRSAAESFNFQKACHNIIVMDIVNFNTIVQIIGRCYRIGQLHEQFIKILMLNRSYDQSILATYAYAMIAQLAATSGSAVDHITDEKCADALHDDDFKAEMEGRSKFTQRTLIEEAREELYSRIVHAKLRRNFGLRSDRDNAYWANARNPDARFAIREEREFYLGLGGDIAAQVNRFLAAGKDDPAPNTPQSKGVQDHKTRLENTAKREEKQRRRMERQEASRKRKAEAEEDEAARKKRKIEKLKANLRKLEGGNSG